MSWLQQWKQKQKIKQAAKDQGLQIYSPKQKAKKDYEKLVAKMGKPKNLGDMVANYMAPKGNTGGYYNAVKGPAPGTPGASLTGVQTIPQFKPEKPKEPEKPKAEEEPTPEPEAELPAPETNITDDTVATEQDIEKMKPFNVKQDPITIGNPSKKRLRGGIGQFASGRGKMLPSIKSKLLNV